MSIGMGPRGEPEGGGGKVQGPQWFGAGTAGKSDSNFLRGSVAHLTIP